MHYLVRNRLHLSQFHPLMRMLLTFYIASVLVARGVSVLKYTDRGAWSPSGLSARVRGTADTIEDPFGDPLAGSADGLRVQEGMSRRELIDVVHPHLFTVPLVLFLLGHLLHLTRLPSGWKLGINAAAFTSCLATFLLPLALQEHPWVAPLLWVSGTTLLAAFAALCLIPLVEMWGGRPGRGFDALPGRSLEPPLRRRRPADLLKTGIP